MAQNIVFLDIDGVLNNVASSAIGVQLLPEKIVMIDNILQTIPDTKVVISSTWRKLYPIGTLQEMLYRTGLSWSAIIDYTPDSRSAHRGKEIAAWLSSHPEVTNYVIVDDDSDMLEEQLDHFVQVDSESGLTFEHYNKIIQILTG